MNLKLSVYTRKSKQLTMSYDFLDNIENGVPHIAINFNKRIFLINEKKKNELRNFFSPNVIN